MHFQSKNKTILIVADPHQDMARLEKIIEAEKPDQTVCLGDWFDSFSFDEKVHVVETCQVLKKRVLGDNFVTCIGNHDIHYLYDNGHLPCSGYSSSKHSLILEELGFDLTEIRKRFQWYVWVDDYLCSHAGLHPAHLGPRVKLTKDSITNWLEKQAKQADTALMIGDEHWMYKAGEERGGSAKFGGINWLDFDVEFMPIPGIKQIVGHSAHRSILPNINSEDGSLSVDIVVENNDNLDIDCYLNEYLTINNGKLKIKKYVDL